MARYIRSHFDCPMPGSPSHVCMITCNFFACSVIRQLCLFVLFFSRFLSLCFPSCASSVLFSAKRYGKAYEEWRGESAESYVVMTLIANRSSLSIALFSRLDWRMVWCGATRKQELPMCSINRTQNHSIQMFSLGKAPHSLVPYKLYIYCNGNSFKLFANHLPVKIKSFYDISIYRYHSLSSF